MIPFVENLKENKSDFEGSLKKSFEGLEKTKNMTANKGRSSYLGENVIGYYDGGAYLVYHILQIIFEFITKNKIN